MKKRVDLVLAAIACTVLLAGAFSTGAWAVGEEFIPAEAGFQRVGHGWRLVTPKGMALYVFDRDQIPGKSTCNAACAEKWPPLIAPADAVAQDDWSVIAREDGKRQWAFRGKPLYAYTEDGKPGDEFGDDVNQQWHVALKPIPTPSGIGILKSSLGQLLTDTKSMTLYVSDADRADKSVCDVKCAETWRPLEAPWTVRVTPMDWNIVARSDGTKQWAYKNKPLYTYAGDVNAGESQGDGVQGRHAVVLQPAPPNPSWVTFQNSDGGMLLADAKGMTLYAHDTGRRRRSATGDMERPQDWKPVLASPADQPIGNWSIIEQEGQRQWAYKGLLLYTNLRDKQPGELNGVRSSDRAWRTIMRSGQPMQGTGA